MEKCFASADDNKCLILDDPKSKGTFRCVGYLNCRFYKTKEEFELGRRHEVKVGRCKVCEGNVRIKPSYTGREVTGYRIVCYDCGLSTRVFTDKAELIKYWNGGVQGTDV